MEQQTFFKKIASCKSPLFYVGGKEKLAPIIKHYLPKELTEICCPFVGGGSVELYLAKLGIQVYASDHFKELINFWSVFLKEPYKLASFVKSVYPLTDQFLTSLLKGKYDEIKNDFMKAGYFWCLNKQTFNSLTMARYGLSSNSQKRNLGSTFTESWRNWYNPMRIEQLDYKEALNKYKGKFLYLDPPYPGREALYGRIGTERKFDHLEFAEILKNYPGNWILSYRDEPFIRELYQDYEIIEPEWTYTVSKDTGKKSRELLILNLSTKKVP